MTDTTDQVDAVANESAAPAKRARRGTGLSGMVLAELQQVAAGLGISGTSKMRKGDLIAAIKERQGSDAPAAAAAKSSSPRKKAAPAKSAKTDAPATDVAATSSEPAAQNQPVATGDSNNAPAKSDVSAKASSDASATSESGAERGGSRRREQAQAETLPLETTRSEREPSGAAPSSDGDSSSEAQGNSAGRNDNRQRNNRNDNNRSDNNRNDNNRNDNQRNGNDRGDNRNDGQRNDSQRGGNDDQRESGGRDDNQQRGNRNNDRGSNNRDNDNQRNDNQRNNRNSRNNDRFDDDDDNGGGRGRRRRRGRDRFRDNNGNNRGGRNRGNDRYDEPQINEDDVLVPIAGILDVLDNYAFVRTSGYLTGANDVYVSLSQVRRYSLRRGDAITGAVKAPREGERREKYNALVRLDTVNGLDVEAAKSRPEFTKLTPLYPQKRLRLETQPNILTTRIIDLVMPIGKGQRALIASPPKAGKTSVLQAIANAITTNNPECHLMVVLVDERPEEVTDMQRSVKGEVIASTFDRPPTDHTTVAELSIERAKRLVELGHDVVVLLDSITRLGRAYNLAAPTSGRILSGGVDSTALYPPKRFLGAARNIENGGSLTIIATALVETGSMMDSVIYEEFKGTGNAELKLDRKIADKRVFPAVDVDASGTRKEEILLSREELAIIIKLRRVLHALDPIEAIDLLISRMKKTQNNAEFLMQIAKNTPGADDD
ncbi:transcription termination factor Rho [Cumulibacter soli]|uniref:transcription termination factor Rho n=1 Tax=Cumulibacter soli TaxID=2546344 RepID=UPI001067A158|nr:transcription termination factor Rho [Cumulibacter soli]